MINPIKKYRGEKSLTQVDLALLVSVSQVFISQWETGGLIPSEQQLRKLAKALDIDPDRLREELMNFHEDKKRGLEKRLGIS